MEMVSGDNKKNNFTKMMRTEGHGKEQRVKEEGQMEASYAKNCLRILAVEKIKE